MKRGFLSKRNALLSSKGVSAGVAAVVFVLLVALVRFFAPNLFLTVFAPAFSTGNTLVANVHGVLSGFEEAAALAQENARLSEQNTALMIENRTLSDTTAKCAVLGGGDSSIVAGVLARPPETAYDTLILGAGLTQGIVLGMEVFAEGGVPVGVITRVDATHALATLFSSPGKNTEGWVGTNHIPLTLKGAGGGSFMATLPRSVVLEPQALVYLPGPGALSVGTVVRIDADPASPEQVLRIAPITNLFSLTWVTVQDSGAAFQAALVTSTSTPL